MKTPLLLSVLLLLFSSTLSFAQNQMSVVGTWKFVSGKSTRGDSTTSYDDKTVDQIKIVTPTHFAVFSKDFANAAAGTVQIDDKNYIEEIKYCTLKDWLGKNVKFTYRIDGDKWYVKGGIENTVMFDEVRQRVSK